MSDKPHDPAADKAQTDSFEQTYGGQKGHGVVYENEQFQSEHAQVEDLSRQRGSGSYETRNVGGYGTAQPDAEGRKHADEGPISPPDPESGFGQGGQ